MKKKYLAIGLLIFSILGFIFIQNLKSNYSIYNQRIISNEKFVYTFKVEANNTYLLSLWAVDEETGLQQWADLDFTYKLLNAKNEVLSEKRITASDSDDDGGVRRAGNGDDFKFTLEKTQELNLYCQLLSGDYYDVEIFQNLPDNLYWFPVLFICLFVFSLFFYLKNRN